MPSSLPLKTSGAVARTRFWPFTTALTRPVFSVKTRVPSGRKARSHGPLSAPTAVDTDNVGTPLGKVKMPPSGGGEPVAVAGRGGGHADDRPVQRGAAGRSEEVGVAEGEDAAV